MLDGGIAGLESGKNGGDRLGSAGTSLISAMRLWLVPVECNYAILI